MTRLTSTPGNVAPHCPAAVSRRPDHRLRLWPCRPIQELSERVRLVVVPTARERLKLLTQSRKPWRLGRPQDLALLDLCGLSCKPNRLFHARTIGDQARAPLGIFAAQLGRERLPGIGVFDDDMFGAPTHLESPHVFKRSAQQGGAEAARVPMAYIRVEISRGGHIGISVRCGDRPQQSAQHTIASEED